MPPAGSDTLLIDRVQNLHEPWLISPPVLIVLAALVVLAVLVWRRRRHA